MATRRLYRSGRNRMVWGVAGGLAEYLDVDPALVRIGFVLLTLAHGLGILVYLVLAIAVPGEEGRVVEGTATGGAASPDAAGQVERPQVQGRRHSTIGLILIFIGVFILLGNVGFFWWFTWERFWPLVIIALGVAILLAGVQRRGR